MKRMLKTTMQSQAAVLTVLMASVPLETLAQAVPGEVEGLTSVTHAVSSPATDDVIRLNWQAPSGDDVTGYSFELDQSASTVPDATPENEGAGSTAFTSASLADGEYYFHVRAVNSLGAASPVARIGPLIIDTTGPAPVSALQTVAGDTQVSLSWNTPASSDFDSVVIRYRTDGQYPVSTSDGSGLVVDEDTASGTAAEYVHEGLINDTEYRYAVFALDSLGNVSEVNTVAATPEAESVPGEDDSSGEDDGGDDGGDDSSDSGDDGSGDEDSGNDDSGNGDGSGGGAPVTPPADDDDDRQLGGEVELDEDMTDVGLDSGAVIRGGSLGGRIKGTPAGPAVLRTSIRDGAHLSHVIIGEGAELGNDIQFGEGVRFESAGAVPHGRELRDMLPSLPGDGADAPVRIGLNRHVLNDRSGTILDDINALPEISSFGVALRQNENGDVSLSVDGVEYRVMPLSLRRVEEDLAAGLHYNEQGRVLFVTDDGLAVAAASTLTDPAAFHAEAGELEFAVSTGGEGQLRVSDGGGQAITARAALGAVPSEREAPGVYTVPDPLLPGATRYVFVQEDDSGELREQMLSPAPHTWTPLQGLLEDTPGVESPTLAVDGTITATVDGVPVTAVMDYRVETSDDSDTGGDDQARFEPAGDLNGDGVDDFVIIFPDGARQNLFIAR